MDKISTFLAQRSLFFENLNSKISYYIFKENNLFLKGTRIFALIFSIPIILVLINFKNHLGYAILSCVVVFFLFISLIFWHKIKNDTKEKIYQLKKVSEEKIESKGVFLNNNLIYERLYLLFAKYDYIDEEKTSVEDFIKVLTLPFNSHNSVIYFNLPNGGVKLVIDRFKKFNENLTLTSVEESCHLQSKTGELRKDALRKGAHKLGENNKNEINSNLDLIFKPFIIGDK